MKIIFLSLFHKFLEIRTCGRLRTPNVAFWVKVGFDAWF